MVFDVNPLSCTPPQYAETSGGLYTVKSVSAIPGAISKWGVAIYHVPGLAARVTDGALKELEQLAEDALPIFKAVLKGKDSKYINEAGVDGQPNGFVQSTYGSYKRRQIAIQGTVMKDFMGEAMDV